MGEPRARRRVQGGGLPQHAPAAPERSAVYDRATPATCARRPRVGARFGRG